MPEQGAGGEKIRESSDSCVGSKDTNDFCTLRYLSEAREIHQRQKYEVDAHFAVEVISEIHYL